MLNISYTMLNITEVQCDAMAVGLDGRRHSKVVLARCMGSRGSEVAESEVAGVILTKVMSMSQ